MDGGLKGGWAIGSSGVNPRFRVDFTPVRTAKSTQKLKRKWPEWFRVDFTPVRTAKSTQKLKRKWPEWFRVDFTPVRTAKSTQNISVIRVGAISTRSAC